MALAADSKPTGENNFGPTASSMMHPMMSKQQHKTMPPIMRHVLPDESNFNDMPSNFHPVKISHAVTLFKDPHSSDLTKRHLHILQKIVAEYEDGFYLRDLVDILIIINACADRCGQEPRYVRPMIEVVKIAEKPFKKEKLSDDVAYKGVLKDTYAQLGFLLRIDNEELQLQICNTLLAIYLGTAAPAQPKSKPGKEEESETVRNAPDEAQRVPVEYSRYMLELSGVAETLVKALTLLQSPLVINLIFQNLRHLTTKSSTNCDLVLKTGGAFAICAKLPTVEEDIDRGLYLATEILWNLLEFGDAKAVTKQLANQSCMRALGQTFVEQVPKTYSKNYRTVRNDLLAIINLIAKTDPLAPLIEVGLAENILAIFSFTETRTKYEMTKQLRFSESEEDFEFKRMLLAVIVNLSQNPSITPLMKQYKLLYALFYYVSPVPEKDLTWLPSQFEEIQLQCLAVIPKLLPQLLDQLVEIGGLETLYNFLEWCLAPSDQDYKGHGNSVYATGGRGSKLAQAKYVLRILKRVISFGEETIIENMISIGLMETYMKELNRLTEVMEQTEVHNFTPRANSVKPDAFISLDITCEILYTISTLMETNNERKDNLGQEAVQLLAKILQLDSKKVCLGLGYTRLLLATLESVWCCICGSYTNECYFLEQEGAFVLLDLLEVQMNNSKLSGSARSKSGHVDSLKSVLLGCLLDLLENPKSLHHVMTWTGKHELKLGKLLIILWQQDSSYNREALEPKSTPEDNSMFIQDTENPLQTALEENTPRMSKELSYSISQIGLDLKPKIYGILSKIGFTELPGLVPTDYIWLASIERYFDFKISEVWKEITEELRQEALSPIGQDKQALEAISRISRDRAEATLTYQKSLHEAFEQQERADEHIVYSEIKAMRKQQEKLKTDFNAYVERTSNLDALKKAKREQIASIENSRIDSAFLKHPFFHTTAISNLNTTVFASHHVNSDNLLVLPDDQKANNKKPTTASAKKAFFNPESETI